MANLLPWQGQSIVPLTTLFTVQPWWVQMAENAANVPCAGWVTTTFLPTITVPPPTGMSLVVVNFSPVPPPGGAADVESDVGAPADGGAAPWFAAPPWSGELPQAASAA